MPIGIRALFVRQVGASYLVKPHAHQVLQWYHVHRGDVEAEIDRRPCPLRQGQGVLVPAGALRSYRAGRRPPTYLVAVFEDRALHLAPIAGQVIEPAEDLRSDLDALVADLQGVGQADSPLLRQALLVRLLLGLRRQIAGRPATPVGGEAGFARQVEEVMRANLHRRLTREELAEAVGLSAPHLARLYRAAAGITLHRRLLALRLEEARRLLAESTQSVSRVAGEVGFDSFSHFTKAFAREAGCTPTAFRRRMIRNR